jgi:hypothetical protein
MNTPTVTVGGKVLKVGDTFTLKSYDDIKWESSRQWIKVRDNNNKRTRVLTKHTVSDNHGPRPLSDYLVKKKFLATRGWGDDRSRQQADSLVQLADTIAFRLGDFPSGRNHLYIAASVADFKERTKLAASPDGEFLYLTRAIYGHHEPPNAATYVTILRYNTSKPDEPAENLGYLLVEALPLELK